MITKDNEPIYLRSDGVYVINGPAGPYACAPRLANPGGYASREDVEDYLAINHLTLSSEPSPPPLSPEKLASAMRVQRDAALFAHDTQIAIALRAQRQGDPSATARLTALDAYAAALCDWPQSDGFPDLATLPKLE